MSVDHKQKVFVVQRLFQDVLLKVDEILIRRYAEKLLRVFRNCSNNIT
jgi:hypothetical protein